MPHKQEINYKVCIYADDYSSQLELVKVFRTYDKAKKFLSDYLKSNDKISRAYIEKACSYRNDKRHQWN